METKHQQFSGTLGELAERYINGDTFYQFDAGHAYALSDNIKAVDLKKYYKEGVFEAVESAWYENLGDGVLCWVWDEDEKNISFVTAYSNMDNYPYEGFLGFHKHAKPLTKEEAVRFVWGEV